MRELHARVFVGNRKFGRIRTANERSDLHGTNLSNDMRCLTGLPSLAHFCRGITAKDKLEMLGNGNG